MKNQFASPKQIVFIRCLEYFGIGNEIESMGKKGLENQT